MSRFTDYAEAVARGLTLRWKFELTTKNGVVLATTESVGDGDGIRWGAQLRPVSWQNDRVSTQNATLSIPVTDDALIPSERGDLLHPDTGNLVVLWAGFDLAAGTTYYKIGTLVPQTVDGSWSRGVAEVDVALVDRARPLQSEVEASLPFSSGTPVETVVRKLCAQVLTGVTSFSIASTGFSLPDGSIEPGETRMVAIEKLLGGCGHELTTDVDGRVYSRPLPTTKVPSSAERWVYGDDGFPVDNVRRSWSTKTPQAWRVEGGSLQNEDDPIIVTVYDTDPTSQGYYNGSAEAQVRTSRYPFVRTKRQATDAGYAQLRRNGVGKMEVSFTAAPNPALREGDPVSLKVAGLKIDGVFRVSAFQLPTMADGSMSVTVRHGWDARVHEQGSPGDTGEPVDYIFDDFNRANQNLEDKPPPGEPGSPNWTEFGYSWGVVGERAVQRYNDGWSFARYNSPLTSSAHSASMVVGPSTGHEIGPLIRSTGNFDGYSALASPDGKIRVVSWQGGKQAGTLATLDYGASLVGKTVKITAESPFGTNERLRVYVDGASQTSGIDLEDFDLGEHHGTYVGMLAFGKGGASAPYADDFTATVL